MVSRECCVIGGGIIGLSIARELAGRGHRVRVLARERRRDTASWAAAGIFPPVSDRPLGDPNAALTAFSDRLHRRWAAELRAETGIDTGLVACGGLHLAAEATGLERLEHEAAAWRSLGVRCEQLAAAEVAGIEPALAAAVAAGRIAAGLLLPDEMRIRPPRHLEALERSCTARGVELVHDTEVVAFSVAGGRLTGVEVRRGAGRERFEADSFVLAAGAWTGGLAEPLGLTIDTRPIRGQIALLAFPEQRLARVVNRGLDYLVPREDGRVLAGSTLEDIGFDRATVAADIDRLLGVAADLLGDLSAATVERSWAGLRPGTIDGLPRIGRVPACANAFLAAGHFRAGLHQSTGTAVLVADFVEGRPPALEVEPFAPARPAGPPGPDSVPVMLARAAEASLRQPAGRSAAGSPRCHPR